MMAVPIVGFDIGQKDRVHFPDKTIAGFMDHPYTDRRRKTKIRINLLDLQPWIILKQGREKTMRNEYDQSRTSQEIHWRIPGCAGIGHRCKNVEDS